MRRKAVTARIPEHEVALVERAAEVLGYTRSTFVRKAAVGVALYKSRARLTQQRRMRDKLRLWPRGLEAALALVEREAT